MDSSLAEFDVNVCWSWDLNELVMKALGSWLIGVVCTTF